MNRAARAIVGVVFVLGCAVAVIAASGELARDSPGGLSLFLLIAAYVPYAAVGSILVTRRPRNLIGWVLLGMGWTFALSFLPIDATVQELQNMTASPLQEAIAWLTEFSLPLTFTLFAMLAFLFPTGKLPVGRWRRYAALVLGLIWSIAITAAIWPVLTVQPAGAAGIIEVPNPIGLLPRTILDVSVP